MSDTMDATTMIRALHGAVAIDGGPAPYNVAHFRLHYPARWTGADSERLTGILPADETLAPWPLAIVLPGINVGADAYRWLACSLAHAGIATATFDLVEEVMPGTCALSPGLDISAVSPSAYGTRPSGRAIAPLIEGVRHLCLEGPTAGLVDCDRVLVIGHSAGGTVALENASTEWFPGVRGVAAYGSHTMPAEMLGHPTGTVLPMPSEVPTLLIAGTDDGVIRNSADRYRAESDHDPVRRTFREACRHRDSRLVFLDGANHMVMAGNGDTTTARGFLDAPSSNESQLRNGEFRCLIAGLVTAFARGVLDPDGGNDMSALDALKNHDFIDSWEGK